MRKVVLTSGVGVLSLALAACGGGGGGGSSTRPQPLTAPPPAPTPTPTPAPPSTGLATTATPGPYNTAEYQSSNAAVAAKAITAYNQGATGFGVKVGVIDSGINPTLPEFAGRLDKSISRDVAGDRGISDEGGHGTAVSAVIAANKDGSVMHGVAFDAFLLNFRADTPGSCADTSGDGCTFTDTNIAAGVRAAVDGGAKVINMSLGGSAPNSTLLSAFSYAVSKGVVLVISAGNDGAKPEGANADPFAAVPAQQYPGMVIIAGSVGTYDSTTRTSINTDQISSFSNRAGTSANSYLMALGAGVLAPSNDGKWYRWDGTSFSAPTITGAVALLAQAFPNLTGSQIVDILFKSADDLGAPGIDSIYGRGRLNIDRAFQPIGTTSLAGTAVQVTGTSTPPPASGDASVGGSSIGAIILDGYSRAFAVDLARSIRTAPKDQPLGGALANEVRSAGSAAGPISIAMTVSERRGGKLGLAMQPTDIGPDDLRKSRLIAGSVVAKIDNRTAMALGFKEGARAMTKRLAGVGGGNFLIARDVAGEHGFTSVRGNSLAVRHDFGPVSATVAGETGEVWNGVRPRQALGNAPYRWTSITLDRRFRRTGLSAGVGRLEEKRTLLGGEFTAALGGGAGANTTFLDLEASRDFGSGITAALSARQGWTRFAGGSFRSGAYALDVAKSDLLVGGDRLGLRLSQPLRIEQGGLKLLLPTSYSYVTETPTMSMVDYSLAPRGREVDAELSYTRGLWDGAGWIGGNLFARRQPGHYAAADTDIGAAVRFTLGF